jgi:hypothetical protein
MATAWCWSLKVDIDVIILIEPICASHTMQMDYTDFVEFHYIYFHVSRARRRVKPNYTPTAHAAV